MDLSKNTKLLPHIIPSLLPKDGQIVTVKAAELMPYPKKGLELSFEGTQRTIELDNPKKIAKWCRELGFETNEWGGRKVKLLAKKFGKNEYIDVLKVD